MSDAPKCPKCEEDNSYLDGLLFVCPSCAHEWSSASAESLADASAEKDDDSVRDANGNPLQTGDSVIVIKDLKVKGSSLVVKGGTKVKNIRLVDGDHNIDCRIDGVGAMQLKSEFVKKA